MNVERRVLLEEFHQDGVWITEDDNGWVTIGQPLSQGEQSLITIHRQYLPTLIAALNEFQASPTPGRS